jgi:PAS domain S-box-containing protein
LLELASGESFDAGEVGAMSLLQRFSNLRIRNKLLISYSAVFFLSLTVGNTIIYHFVRRNIESNIESELQNTTTAILNMVKTAADVSIKNHLRAVAEKNKDIVKYFYAQYVDGHLSEAEARARAGQVLLSQRIGKTGYIYCLDSEGNIVIHPRPALLGVDLSAYAFIRDQKKRKVGYLEYDWKNPGESSPRPKALYMTYFEPWDWIISVSSYRSEFNELVNVDDFRQSVLSLTFGQTGYSYVLDLSGNLIIHPKLAGINILNETDANDRHFIRDMIKMRSGKIIYAWKNPDEAYHREKLVIFNYIPEFQWIVASSSYLDEFYAPLKTVERIFFFTVTVTLMLVLPLTQWISSTITNPLRELMHKFSQGAEGDISVRMQRRAMDEIGRLAQYFNTFMQTLKAYGQSLKAEIADRKKAEAAIRKSEAKYRELVENANSIILRVDSRGRITFFNEFAQSFFGFSEAEIVGRTSVGTIMPPNDSDGGNMWQMMKQIARHPERHGYYETEAMRRNGERIWVAWTHRAVRDSQGRITEYLCIGHDITESRAAEQEMAKMRHYLQNIVDFMPSILIGVDLSGTITQWNREAYRLTGVAQAAALGKDLAHVLPRFEAHREMILRAISHRILQKTEKVSHPAREPSGYYADIMVYPIIVQHVEGAVIRVDDVTARVRMQEVMVQTEKMMSVGGLAAGMAHEINNPLGAMLQSTQNILRRVSDELTGNHEVAEQCGTHLAAIRSYLKQRRIFAFLEAIRESGERAHKIVDNMLSFSRRSESRKQRVALAALLDKTISLAAHDYDLKKKHDFRRIKIIKEFETEPIQVACVPMEIEQVVLNLLRNAAQAMNGGRHGEGAPRITLRLYRDNSTAVIEVEDNGPGMDPQTLKRIFEPFFTTKDIGIGTGLGLSVSYFIITNNHNGTIEVSSRLAEGTNFIVRLPMEAAALSSCPSNGAVAHLEESDQHGLMRPTIGDGAHHR